MQGSENYTMWRSHILGELQQKNCDWTITGRPEPTRETVTNNATAMGFLLEDFTPQAIYTALTAEIKEHRAALKKAEGIIVNSVALKH